MLGKSKNMKAYLSLFLGLTLILVSCEKNDDSINNELSALTTLTGENGLSYNESLSKWNELKTVNGNSYIYQTTSLSWAGFESTTEVKVVEGEVRYRVFQETKTDQQTGESEITYAYTENENALGNHERGAAPLTIDELYNSCASEYLAVDELNNTIYFEAEVNGLMTLCGFLPNDCVDDCNQDISINAFDWID